jgi:hypothetical protein
VTVLPLCAACADEGRHEGCRQCQRELWDRTEVKHDTTPSPPPEQCVGGRRTAMSLPDREPGHRNAPARLRAKQEILQLAHEQLIETARRHAFGCCTDRELADVALDYSAAWGEQLRDAGRGHLVRER